MVSVRSMPPMLRSRRRVRELRALPAASRPARSGTRHRSTSRRRARVAGGRRRAADRARRGLLRRRGGRRRAPRRRSLEGPAAECFAAQQRDEERHARFFARYAATVGLTDPRAHCSDAFLELFEVRLPEAAARRAAARPSGSTTWSWRAWSSPRASWRCSTSSTTACPGCARAPSSCCATSAGTSASARAAWPIWSYDEAAILDEGARAAALWAPEYAERVVDGLRSRLRAVRRQRAALLGEGRRRRARVRGDRGRGARARLPARGARLGRAVARLPGAARGGDGPAGADLFARGPRAVRRAGGAADAAVHARRGARGAAGAAAGGRDRRTRCSSATATAARSR